ncbi:MAG: glycosyltransferase [Burkholderiales bacterium]|nr:glycosyltransferase [Burkholderiales bacterium]MBY0576492.1 glycosyltransferase [Gallionellaceae bacterium]
MSGVPISIVIPAYNAEKYLQAALDSILAQTFSNFEAIVIDDCSTDRTWEIVAHYAECDNRIRPYRNEMNLGIAGNRNRGVELARGKYLAWQDADDISFPQRLEKQYRFMEENPHVGIVGAYIEIFHDDDTVIGVRKYPQDDGDLRRCIFRYSPIAQPAAMVRREALLLAGPYNLRFPPAEDIDMTFRIGEHYKLANIPEVLVRYRENPSSATFTRLKKMELSTLEIRRKYSKSASYKMTAGDWIYNVAHYISVWLVPPKLKIRLFNFWRNSLIT